ncbi:PREDICTED: putative disease resistance RPP13-like protein 1 [Prunus mume]|uniref:Disease resistance RPP13-like protein 1 n=1 Tax=Prunus mume TaxID=102107 RepID=A0ABM1LYL7_PRUMU|nr:PREDICTED: putative disease resistance RPP13-like protein 1 [Prunus mume]
MAGALIGEALISASIEVICDRIASREFVDLFRHKKLDQPLLDKLRRTLLTLNAFLDDAEKQIEKPTVREWLDDLKHAVFDAEDLLDEINYEDLRCKLKGDAQTDNFTSKVCTFLPTSRNKFYRRMNAKIQELLQRLENFVQLKGALGLRENVGRKVAPRTPTTSLVHEPCVYGRDEAKQNLLEVLFDDASEENVSVIPIVGMGGVGKTTLARMLYNDNKVKEHFTLKAWACVSEDYDAIRVTKTLLESVTSKPCKKTDLNLLQVELSEELRGKKFLFVLDDLWNEKYTDWNYLQTPFTSGARGSKVLVTTRNTNIASFMQNVPIQTLEPLSHEDCWFLLAKHANVNSSSHPTLEEIGKKIARKCNGLPLAAQTLGGLLRSRLDSEVWNRVLNSSIWDLPYEKSDILPALGLSYHYLPAKLKRCFIYCSIFPKDYEFKIEDIVFLWMAEGLIPQAENGDSMEEVAKGYFDELLSRSLFQTSGKSSFVMHDLINDLAVFMSKGFCSRWEGRESHEVERVRHLSYAREELDVAVKFEPLKETMRLRTFLSISLNPYYRYERYYVSKKVLHNLLPSLTCLRVLSLSCYTNVTELPDSIKKLIHLRYFDLSNTEIETLPSVLCSLYNLQTLLLSNCSRLVELPADLRKLINLQKLMLGGCYSLTKLPEDMWELINLHHLDVSGTKIAEMPMQMSTLKSLRTLSDFIVGKSTGSTIGELGELPHLGGKLSILQLRNVVDARDALQANLKDKKDLKEVGGMGTKWKWRCRLSLSPGALPMGVSEAERKLAL